MLPPLEIRDEAIPDAAPVYAVVRDAGARRVDALVRSALERSRALVFLVGHPEYYPRFGFERAGSHGFTDHGQDHGSAFMVCELVDNAAARHAGDVAFHPAFAEAERLGLRALA